MWRSKNKYGRTRVEKAGLWFDSKLESAVHDLLLLRQQSGEIKDIRVKHRVNFIGTKINWNVDFSFYNNLTESVVYCEAKGLETQDYKLKRTLWETHGPGVLEIWKGSHTNPFLERVIRPMAQFNEDPRPCHLCLQRSPK